MYPLIFRKTQLLINFYDAKNNHKFMMNKSPLIYNFRLRNHARELLFNGASEKYGSYNIRQAFDSETFLCS